MSIRSILRTLPWLGLAAIVAIPAHDYFTGKMAERPTILTELATPKKVALKGTENADSQVTRVEDAVAILEASGKPLPSYISDAPSKAEATKPTPAATTTPAQPIASSSTTASVPLPIPRPAIERPNPRANTPSPVEVAPPVTSQTYQPVPPAYPVQTYPAPAYADQEVVTVDELETWESGPLSDFLAQRQRSGGYVPPQNVPIPPANVGDDYQYQGQPVWPEPEQDNGFFGSFFR